MGKKKAAATAADGPSGAGAYVEGGAGPTASQGGDGVERPALFIGLDGPISDKKSK
jgi:hypothetical protein